MAKINNVGLNIGHKIANPFKTSRNMSTPNPFKNSNFEGNTLQFADVFEGFEAKDVKQSKLKMIASSVAGSARKLHSSITEPIVNFVRKIGGGISNAWDYAKNTNLSDLPGIKSINEVLNTNISDLPAIKSIGETLNTNVTDLPGIKAINSVMNKDIIDLGRDLGQGISNSISYIGKDISGRVSERLSFMNTDITDIGKTLSASWNSLVDNIASTNGNRITSETSVNELKEMWLEQNRLIAESKVA